MPKKLTANNHLPYYPAELKRSKSGWRIVYYVENPATKEMFRKVIKLNRIKSLTERRIYSRKIIKEINRKLEKGWNPFLENHAVKGYVKMNAALDVFLKEKGKELRPDSMRTYKSYSRMLLKHIAANNISDFAVSFTESHAKDFMQWVYTEKNVSATTFNNYLLTYRVIFNWLINSGYAAINPFQKIKRKKAEQKIRRILTGTERDQLWRHYEIEKPRFLLASLLAFHGLLRPTELVNLKPANILYHKKLIDPPHTKNGKSRLIALPDYIFTMLKKLQIEKQEPKSFIFSSGFRPGHHKLCPRKISKEWERARNLFGWQKDLQFYSLRDSGIVQMLRDGIPIEEVQKHADHAHITTTQKYINIAFPKGVTSIRDKSSHF